MTKKVKPAKKAKKPADKTPEITKRGTSSTIRPRYWSCYSPGAAVVRQSGSFCGFFSIYAEYVNIPRKLHDSGKKDIYLFPNSNIWRRTTIPSVTGMLPNSVC